MGMNNFKKTENKLDRYSIEAICKKIEKGIIRFDHPAQRESGQWTNKMRGNLMSDILQGNPIPPIILAEQKISGVSIVWDLDGKQRCMTVYDYMNGAFKISKQVRRNIIVYQAPKLDDNGHPMFDDNRIPLMEVKEFDITNKFFNQLPEELQDAIKEYCFDAVVYLDCSSEDIVYHIARYNDGKPMNKIQKGVVNLGESYANQVKELASHDFFKDCADFGKDGIKNGNINRAICETIMTTYHLDHWGGNNLEDMCSYLKENGTFDEFGEIEDSLDRLEDIIDGSNESLFTAKETFIWITVFNRFKELNIDDGKFADFLTEFIDEKLDAKVINGVTYKELEGNKSTKDRNLIIKKLNHLETLMKEYLKVNGSSAA